MFKDLYQNLLQKIEAAQDRTDLQLKPIQHYVSGDQKISRVNIQNQLKLLKKQDSYKIDHQIYIICQNIVFSLFSLPSDKFYAILQRIKAWGLQITLQQFIMSYYLFTKIDNALRQFISLNFNKIVSICTSLMQSQLIKNINLQSFASTEKPIKVMKKQLEKTEHQIIDMLPKNQTKEAKALENINSVQDATTLRNQILADLKRQNPQLQEI